MTITSKGLSLVCCLAILVFIACLLPVARAQNENAELTGTIFDAQGLPVPGAAISVRNENTGMHRETVSTGTGDYTVPALDPGTYTIRVEESDFETMERTGITLYVATITRVDLHLTVGHEAQTVTVKADATLLQTQDASVGMVVGSREITGLPLNGRNYTLLAQLSPGVTTAEDDNRNLVNTGSFVANGVPSIYNNYLLDGIDNNNNEVDFLNGAAYVVRPSVDAIAEFKIQTANFSAEYGRAAGAVLNAVTKSGTNALSGSIWEYARNQVMDATDYWVNHAGQKKAEYTRNQFGFTLGGPVRIPHLYNGTDKTFFFLDYEGTRINQAQPYYSNVPTPLMFSSGFTNFSDNFSNYTGTQTDALGRVTKNGQVFDPATTRATTAGQVDPYTGITATATGYVREPFPGNIIPANRLDPVGVKLVNLYPGTDTGSPSSETENYFSQPIKTDNDGEYDVRVDQNISERDQAFGRVSYNSEPVNFQSPCPGLAVCAPSFSIGVQTNKALGVTLGETHTFSPTALNEFRVGYKRIHSFRQQPFYNSGNVSAQYGIAGIPWQPPAGGGLPEFSISGPTVLGGHTSLPSNEVNSMSQFRDNVSKQLGNHSLRFGVEYDRIKVMVIQPGAVHGQFYYSGTYVNQPSGSSDYLGVPQFVILPGPSTVPGGIDNEGGFNQYSDATLAEEVYDRPDYALYFQDDFKLTHTLTLNLGLRWEYFPMPTNPNVGMANFVPNKREFLIDDRGKNIPLSPVLLNNFALDDVSVVYTSNHALTTVSPWNFAPRIGLAWQMVPRLILRAGYGMFYAGNFNNGDGDNLGNNYPYAYSVGANSPSAVLPMTPDLSIGSTENGLANVDLNPLTVNGNNLSFNAQQYNWKLPNVQAMNLSLQGLISPTQTITIAGISTLGRDLNVSSKWNTIPYLLPTNANVTLNLPFPNLNNGMPLIEPAGESGYFGLQGSYEKHLSKGLSLLANHSWSQARSDVTDGLFLNGLSYRAPDIIGFGIKGDYGIVGYDVRHVTHIGSVYDLPFGRGKEFLSEGRVLDAFVGGWRVSGIFTLQSGQPSTVTCTISTAANAGCFALRVPGVSLYKGAHTIQHWANAAAFTNPTPLTSGSAAPGDFSYLGGGPAQIVGPIFHRADFSLSKQWTIAESMALRFRGDAFNITNTPNFSQPGNLSFNSTSFANISSNRDTPNDPREIQLGVDFNFGMH